MAQCYTNLGNVLYTQGQMKDAKEMYEKALKIRLATLGESHSDAADSFNKLGNVLKARGQLKDAKEMYEKALKIRLATLGENHSDAGSCYTNLGNVLLAQGVTSFNNLGNVLKAQGEFKDAKEMYEKALKIRLATLGENHSACGTMLQELRRRLSSIEAS